MQDALNLLESFTETDAAWMLDAGIERQVISKSEIVREGEVPEAVYVVLEGLVSVTSAAFPNHPLAQLGPGEIFGELSFLRSCPAMASVSALENSLLLEVPGSELQLKIDEDARFAVSFYRGMALLESRRLDRTVSDIGQLLAAKQSEAQLDHASWDVLASALDGFKELMVEADKAAARDGEVPPEIETRVLSGFTQFGQLLNDTIGDGCGLSESVRSTLGARAQREALPYLLMSELGDRMYSKPRGYAGDYYTIDIMYRDQPSGTGRLGKTVDAAFRRQKANVAVMNRRGLLAEEIERTVSEADGQAHVTSLASGPAAELFDVFETLGDDAKLRATCIDIDFQALGFVGDKCGRLGLTRNFNLVNGNLVYLAMGRQSLALKPQDLIYSIGLIDYFSDKFVGMLLNYIHDRLRPGGRVILGNFHTSNPDKAMMDYLFEWQLIHRSEDDMNRLFANSKFGRDCTQIRFEDEGVNLFAECVKA